MPAQLLDSRGNPTRRGRRLGSRRARSAARPCRPAPRRASTRPSSCATATRRAYLGKGVLRAVANVNGEIADALVGLDAEDQRALDRAARSTLDGTPNKSRLGANAILGCSLAVSKAAAAARRRLALPLARRSRGAHAARADDERDQRRRARAEPARPPGVHGRSGGRRDVLRGAPHRRPRCSTTCRASSTSAGSRPASATRAGSRPISRRREEAIEAILEAAERAGHRERVGIALDPAASEVFTRRRVRARRARGGRSRPDEHDRASTRRSPSAFPIVSIEDGLDENAWGDWKTLTDALGDRVQLVGDDLFVTNVEFLRARDRRGRRRTRSSSR